MITETRKVVKNQSGLQINLPKKITKKMGLQAEEVCAIEQRKNEIVVLPLRFLSKTELTKEGGVS